MSRSYKKFPMIKCGGCEKWGKVFANRRVRRYKGEISNGSEYKKIYESWDIHDYQYTQFREWAIQEWEQDQAEIANGVNTWKSKYNTTLEEALNDWKKFYKCK